MMEGKWISRKAFYEYCQNKAMTASPLLPPSHVRLLLLSDGTVTHFLESLFLKTILFDLESQSEIVIPDKDAKRLSISKGVKGIERRGWLTLSPPLMNRPPSRSRTPPKKRLLYAVSIFPLSKLSKGLHQEILLGQKPLGRIISDREILFRRHAIEMGQFQLPEITRQFGFSPDEPVWARRYKLTLSGSVSGLLYEVLSPTISFFKESIPTPQTVLGRQTSQNRPMLLPLRKTYVPF